MSKRVAIAPCPLPAPLADPAQIEPTLTTARTRALLASLAWASLLLGLALGSAAAHAGLTASDVVVAVNGGSFNSRTLANHFVSLRGIPAINVIVLEDIPNSETIGVEDFRAKILRPLLEEIQSRHLENHVQCIAYSADFPTAIDISDDLKPLGEIDIFYTKKGSINGLTYLFNTVRDSVPSYISPEANFYARRTTEAYFSNPGGKLTEESWSQIQQLIVDQKHAEASQSLEKLLSEHPHQFPVAYLAAAEAAQAKNASRATKLMEQAINLGWNAGDYFAKDQRFDPVRDDSDFQVLELLMNAKSGEFQLPRGFEARELWTPNGVPTTKPQFGLRFMLSTVLGVTRGSGMTLAQCVDALKRSASADFTHPQGTFYFSVTQDVRTETRKWGFLGAIDSLTAMGYEAELIQTALPTNAKRVLGAQIGTATFDWPSSHSHFVPGALADNLTSLGGVMVPGNSQTKLTELIKSGAAGSSGAVTEPYALQFKFPHPQMYVYYASGCSLAEAFYLSVTSPYQLLIVGDPLCRPFSNAPRPELDDQLRYHQEDETLELQLDLSGISYADLQDSTTQRSQRREALIPTSVSVLNDGANPQIAAFKSNINIRLTGMRAGYHEVTLRFGADDPLLQRSETKLPIWIGERELVTLTFPKLKPVDTSPAEQGTWNASLRDQKLAIKVWGKGAKRVGLWHDWEQIATADGSQGEFEIGMETLGLGPVRLQAKIELEDGTMVASLPHHIEILP